MGFHFYSFNSSHSQNVFNFPHVQLHRWGFTKMLRGKECGAYCHKDFQRGRMDLCAQMRCCDRDGLRALPNDDTSLSSSEIHQPQSYELTREVQEFPCQEARKESYDYVKHAQHDGSMHPYAHPMALPMPRLPESFPGVYSTTYRPPMPMNYYDWNSWSNAPQDAGPSRDYEHMMRSGWQYSARDYPQHRMESHNRSKSSQNL